MFARGLYLSSVAIKIVEDVDRMAGQNTKSLTGKQFCTEVFIEGGFELFSF